MSETKNRPAESLGSRAFFPAIIGTRDEEKKVIYTNVTVGGVTTYQYLAFECLTALLANPNHAPGPETRVCAREQARLFLQELDDEMTAATKPASSNKSGLVSLK